MRSFLLAAVAALTLATGAVLAQQVVRGPYLQLGTHQQVVVRWRTDVATDSRVVFGTSVLALNGAATDATLSTEHEILVGGLLPETRYYYAIGTQATLLAGGDADHVFKTAPIPGASRRTRLWCLGDSGTGGTNARRVRDAYAAFAKNSAPDLWLMLGDNAYTSGTDTEYQTAMFSNMYEATLRRSVLWPTPGNHDAISAAATTQQGPYYDIFTLPTQGEVGGASSGTEAYYSFDYGDVHFLSLNSTSTDPNFYVAQLAWLQQDLAQTTARWIIAYWHHPPYSKGSHDSDTSALQVGMRQSFNPVLEAAGVDLVLGGHSHSYERSMLLDGHYGDSTTFVAATMAKDAGDGSIDGQGAYRKPVDGIAPHDGAVYVVCGSSGTISSAPLNHPVMVSSRLELGSLVLDVEGSQLDVRFLNADGFITDHTTLVKGVNTAFRRHENTLPPLSTWKYHDLGVDLAGLGWQSPAFDDSLWSQGPAPLGFGESFIATPTAAGPTTAYFRRDFVVGFDPTLIEAFTLSSVYDDGFVAYVNGVEVLRRGLAAGAVGYSSLAVDHEATRYETFDLSAAIPYLVEGPNVLAVELHQSSSGSSDAVFEAGLVIDAPRALLGPAAAGAVVDSSGNPTSVLRVNGSDGGFSRSVDLAFGVPVTISVSDPPTTSAAAFAVFGRIGTPGPNELTDFGYYGAFCFTPSLLAPGNPFLFLLTSNFAPEPTQLAGSTPTPWVLNAPAVYFPFEFTLQGAILVTPTDVRVTNAVRTAIVP